MSMFEILSTLVPIILAFSSFIIFIVIKLFGLSMQVIKNTSDIERILLVGEKRDSKVEVLEEIASRMDKIIAIHEEKIKILEERQGYGKDN